MATPIEILIAEDSMTQAVRLRHILERDGYRVTVATNGVEALAALEQSLPSLVISDVMMPEMDGYALCRRIKGDARLRHLPVVLLTVLSDPDDVFKALQAGADNYVSKPYESQFLLTNIRRILSTVSLRARQESTADATVYFDGQCYTLDASRTQIVDFLLSTYDSMLQKNRELDRKNLQLSEALDNIRVLQGNYRQLLETNADAVLVVDHEGRICYANPAAAAMLPSATGCLEGTPFLFTTVAGERREVTITKPQGSTVIADMRVVETNWDNRTVNLAVLRDITEQAHMREELKELSLHDGLTGLYNRRGFNLLAEQLLKTSHRGHRLLFLMYIDMDGMKTINDTLGHQEGDAALCDLVGIMQSVFRSSDILGRLGGDEFVVIGVGDGEPTPDELEARLMAAIATHNATAGRPFRLAASVGIIIADPGHPETLETLLERADALMYAQKRAKKAARV